MNILELTAKVRRAKRVYIIGNGGSYANAQHIANDLLAVGIPAFTLDPSTLTASANDHGYEVVFARWLNVVAKPGDLLIALSGSGKSPNIVNACRAAESLGMTVHCEFGLPQGFDMQASEERQIWLGHEAMRALRK